MRFSLQEMLETIRASSGSPALSAVVVTSEEIVDAAAVGVKRLGEMDEISVHDIFHAGSNAKAMTATMCGSLVSEGALAWDTTPKDVFSSDDTEFLPAYERVTLRLLLMHHAGVPPYTDDEADDYVIPDLSDVRRDGQIRAFSEWVLASRPPVVEPGTEFSYSNAGYAIAGAMAEAATGLRWEALLQKHVFEPLGISAMAGKGWPAKSDSSQPWGHLGEEGDWRPHPPNDAYQLSPCLAPAGDVGLSISDYGRFLQVHLRGLRGKESILPSPLVRDLHNGGEPGTGMGWNVKELKRLQGFGLLSTHGGSARTFIMLAAVAHRVDLAVGVAGNCWGTQAEIDGMKDIFIEYAKRA